MLLKGVIPQPHVSGIISDKANKPLSGGLVVKHPALDAKGHSFDPIKRSKLFMD